MLSTAATFQCADIPSFSSLKETQDRNVFSQPYFQLWNPCALITADPLAYRPQFLRLSSQEGWLEGPLTSPTPADLEMSWGGSGTGLQYLAPAASTGSAGSASCPGARLGQHTAGKRGCCSQRPMYQYRESGWR